MAFSRVQTYRPRTGEDVETWPERDGACSRNTWEAVTARPNSLVHLHHSQATVHFSRLGLPRMRQAETFPSQRSPCPCLGPRNCGTSPSRAGRNLTSQFITSSGTVPGDERCVWRCRRQTPAARPPARPLLSRRRRICLANLDAAAICYDRER
ncbi:hypothetical protein AAFF_G00097310 [Aldrovandia affinis]|uniref:Uncharacterized protein n=1 Tax=Aldrovandia affinis TaxID=143900 RepID=A0AAD7WC33_9TELE|nr:hypothetical protein AAFF_G00097310 [Aldrovandia affinis]